VCVCGPAALPGALCTRFGGWVGPVTVRYCAGDTRVGGDGPAGATSIVSLCFAPGPIRLRWWRRQTPTHAAQQVISSSSSSSSLVATNIMLAFPLVGHQASWSLLGMTATFTGARTSSGVLLLLALPASQPAEQDKYGVHVKCTLPASYQRCLRGVLSNAQFARGQWDQHGLPRVVLATAITLLLPPPVCLLCCCSQW